MIFAEIDFVEKISRRVRNEDFLPSVASRKGKVVKDFQNEKAAKGREIKKPVKFPRPA